MESKDQASMDLRSRARARATDRLQLSSHNLQLEERAKKMEEMEMGKMKREERSPFQQINHLFLMREKRKKMMMKRQTGLVKWQTQKQKLYISKFLR